MYLDFLLIVSRNFVFYNSKNNGVFLDYEQKEN